MLGEVPLSGAPFASLGGARVFDRLITEVGTTTEVESASAVFRSTAVGTAAATDSVLVAASTFNAPIVETSTGTALPSASADLLANVSASGRGLDEATSVGDFVATTTPSATGTALATALVDFTSNILEQSTITDFLIGGLEYFADV